MWEFQTKVWEISLYVGNQLVDDSAFSVHSIISAKICIKGSGRVIFTWTHFSRKFILLKDTQSSH